MRSYKAIVLFYVETYLRILAGSISPQFFIWCELHFVSDPTPQWMFHSLPPSPPTLRFRTNHTPLLSLLVSCECCVLFECWLIRLINQQDWWWVFSCDFHGAAVVRVLSPTYSSAVLSPTYSSWGAVKYSTAVLSSTVPRYCTWQHPNYCA